MPAPRHRAGATVATVDLRSTTQIRTLMVAALAGHVPSAERALARALLEPAVAVGDEDAVASVLARWLPAGSIDAALDGAALAVRRDIDRGAIAAWCDAGLRRVGQPTCERRSPRRVSWPLVSGALTTMAILVMIALAFPAQSSERRALTRTAPPHTEATPACIAAAAKRYRVPVDVLHLLRAVEGGRVGQCLGNTNGSRDCGPWQVNSIHVPMLERENPGIDVAQAIGSDGCFNAAAAARVYSLAAEAGGRTADPWTAVQRYHSATPEHATRYLLTAVRRAGALGLDPLTLGLRDAGVPASSLQLQRDPAQRDSGVPESSLGVPGSAGSTGGRPSLPSLGVPGSSLAAVPQTSPDLQRLRTARVQ